MRTPVVYELNDRRRCLLVEDGKTISVGRGEACSIRLEGEAVQDLEFTAQFVNSCQFVVVQPANGGVPYAQPLPWRMKLGGAEVDLLCPAKAMKGASRELVVQGVSAGEMRLVLKPEQPLLLGAGLECEVVIPDASCPDVLLALWATSGNKVMVEVVDNSVVVGWLGRAAESEAELELPISLSIGGRVILISSGEVTAVPSAVAKTKAPTLAPLPKVPAILAKGMDTGPKIVARHGKPPVGKEGAEPSGKPVVHAATYASHPAPLPPPAGIILDKDFPLLTEEVMKGPQPASPTLFIIASWLLVAMTFAVAVLPGQGVLQPEQIVLLWKATGGMLILTLVLGLGALLK
ncbi:MAG: hypothetical protein JWR15_3517 [Prosthecobacter sp.]|nr:hypothetical protein [Prosthecobacter sp.]